MIFARILITLAIALNGINSALASTQCIGPSTATRFVVYLHGMDTPVPGSLEMKNRSRLEKVANELNMRIALPRATVNCPSRPELKCWTWAVSENLEPTLDRIENAANDCFPEQKYSVLGFSNGGYLVHKLLRACAHRNFTSLISYGAAGSWLASDPQDLSNCPLSLSMNVGKSDSSVTTTSVKLYEHFKALNADVSFQNYDGAHELTVESLLQSLSN